MTAQDHFEWFGQLKSAIAFEAEEAYDLLLGIPIEKADFKQIKQATLTYIYACLKKSDLDNTLDNALDNEADLLNYLAGKSPPLLINRTPNGVILPKQEQEQEFNRFSQAVAQWFQSLGIDQLYSQVNCPIICRLVEGNRDRVQQNRPYATNKIHLDLWNGDPADNVNIFIPICGDIQNTSVEFFCPSPELLENYHYDRFQDYSQGEQRVAHCEPYPLKMRCGYAYFMDALVPHRTAQKGGGIRISLELRMRRKVSELERQTVERTCLATRLPHYIPLRVWYELNQSKIMKFKDTWADAEQGIFTQRPSEEPIYTIVPRL